MALFFQRRVNRSLVAMITLMFIVVGMFATIRISQAAPIEIILDNGDAGTSVISGNWSNATAASEHYGPMSLYASVGSNVDTYRFTPDLPEAGDYEVYAWNSCYSNRADDTVHRIVHAGGTTTLAVDQDCDTGSHGEWNLLGTYTFNQGTSGYLEISDEGVAYDPNGLYIGADAARFYKEDSAPDTTPPTVSITAPADQSTVSGPINITANASDDVEVAGVQFTVNGNNHGAEDTTTPYSISLDTTTLADGVHGIGAIARDTSNNTANATSISVTVDNSVPTNNPPVLSVSTNSLTVDENDPVSLTATAADTEDGDLTSSIQWSSTDGNSGTGGSFNFTATEDATITVTVTDSGSESDTEIINLTVVPLSQTTTFDDFDCEVSSLGAGYTTYNATAIPVSGKKCGRYYAEVTDNSTNQTTFYQGDQGRLDAVTVTFPFTVTARNVGIGTIADSQTAATPSGSPYIFAGLNVHVPDYNTATYAQLVAGHRGGTYFTVEGKTTIAGSSSTSDEGYNAAPLGRVDLRLEGVIENGQNRIKAYWQAPNPDPGTQADNWTSYGGTGYLPNGSPSDPVAFSGNQAMVSLITYAYYETGLPFVGTADSLEIVD